VLLGVVGGMRHGVTGWKPIPPRVGRGEHRDGARRRMCNGAAGGLVWCRYLNLTGQGRAGGRMERIMRNAQNSRVWKMGFTVAAASVSFLWGVGCVSYTNVPEPSSAPAFKHANSGSSIKVIVASLDRVVGKHPLRDGSGRYAVNLPAGTTPETAHTIVSRLGSGANVPFEGMEDSIPVYHISRIWLRGRSGKVDVVYPFMDVDGTRSDRGVTVWLHGGDRPWYVERMQYWAPGTVPTPPVYVPVGREDGGVDSEMTGDEEYEVPTTESVQETADRIEPEFESEPADDGVLYREVEN